MSTSPSIPEFQPIIDRARAERARALSSFLARLGRAPLRQAVRAVRGLGTWYRRRAAASALSALDDRTLKDIGLYRGEIWSVADDIARGLEPARDRNRAEAVAAPQPAEKTPRRPADVLRLPPIYTGARAA